MKKNVIITISIIGLALLGLVLAQGMMGNNFNNQNFNNQGYGYGNMMGGYGNPNFGNYGMMGGYGGGYGNFGGMMGGGMGMMGGMMGGAGMMQVYPANTEPISEADAQSRLAAVVQSFAADASLQNFMVFSNNYYAQIVDANGIGLGEVLMDRYTGAVYPEMGPNMMWNARYGMMGFGFGGTARYDEAAAQELAETFLSNYLPGATVSSAQAFSGYYSFDYGREQTEGMLSVNAITGEVWVHNWHGIYLGGHE